MIKNFLKIANVKNERDFYKKFPTEEAFFKAHPEAEMMMYGGMYRGGGGTDNPGFRALPDYVQHKIISNMAYGGYYQEGGEEMAQQQGQGGGQQEQIIQFVVQALQKGMPPEQIVQQLAQAGIPQDQATQLVQSIIQRIQQMQQSQQGAQGQGEEMGEPQGQPEGMEGEEQMMRRGGAPCYNCGGSYQYGGPENPKKKSKGSMRDWLDYYPKGQEFDYMSSNYDTDQNKSLRERAKNFYLQGAPAIKGRSGPGMFLRPLVYNEARADWFDNTPGTENFTEEMFDNWKESVRNKPYYQDGGDTSDGTYYQGTYFKHGGLHKKYKKGGTYEMSQKEIQDLVKKGYKIQYL